jgi:hypothetical protein
MKTLIALGLLIVFIVGISVIALIASLMENGE